MLNGDDGISAISLILLRTSESSTEYFFFPHGDCNFAFITSWYYY